ncbi:hypothetical protein [Massilia sp. CF038]|uniref:hypothetical protein n=1 Tax=Massilia sp. CF038 TaxID=1881045 RepID=UPI00091980D3|nr:hypothetical protein [Massilia sp. CF038]SHG56922.1 hypothetical protein SAMN05428948_1072 [Massilia sp. CF038]
MKRMRCTIVIPRDERRSRRDLAGKVAVGLVSLETLGVEVATWYLLSHGISLDTILRVMTMPNRRRR